MKLKAELEALTARRLAKGADSEFPVPSLSEENIDTLINQTPRERSSRLSLKPRVSRVELGEEDFVMSPSSLSKADHKEEDLTTPSNCLSLDLEQEFSLNTAEPKAKPLSQTKVLSITETSDEECNYELT